jgi:hypothetical protein
LAAGLLILRATLGLTILVRGLAVFNSEHASTVNNVVCIVGALAAALLMIGFFTVLAAAFATALCACALAPIAAACLFAPDTTALLAGAIGASIALLGPGAFSVDARLFGPREIVFPPPTGRSGSFSNRID